MPALKAHEAYLELTQRESDFNSNSHQFVNEMKGDYLGLIDYFSEEELPEFEITVKNILRKSL